VGMMKSAIFEEFEKNNLDGDEEEMQWSSA
jgi:hypothetical protein